MICNLCGKDPCQCRAWQDQIVRVVGEYVAKGKSPKTLPFRGLIGLGVVLLSELAVTAERARRGELPPPKPVELPSLPLSVGVEAAFNRWGEQKTESEPPRTKDGETIH